MHVIGVNNQYDVYERKRTNDHTCFSLSLSPFVLGREKERKKEKTTE